MAAPSQPLISGKAPKANMGSLKSPTPPKQGGEKLKAVMPEEILRQSLQKEMPPGTDINKVIFGIKYMVKSNKVKLLQLGNTVFLITPKPNGIAELHTSSIESPQNIVKRWKVLPNSLKQMGFKKAESFSTDPNTIKLVQMTGLPVKINQGQRMMGGKMVPAYTFEMDL